MIDFGIVLISALAGAILWTAIGYPLARRLGLQPALGMAPALGWGVHSGISNVLFRLTGFAAAPVWAASIVMLAFSIYALKRQGDLPKVARSALWIAVLAAVAAIIPTLALIPHPTPDGMILTAPIYDHAKVAIIDEIARGSLPPLNPFFFESGLSDKLAYYWGWYASAAQLSVLFGATGWEADIALSWFTAFSSLLLMMSIAIWLGGRTSAAVFVVLISFTASLRLVLLQAFGPTIGSGVLSREVDFGTWILNMPWVPQHMAGAICAILSTLLIPRLKSVESVVALALLAAAGLGSSAYIGAFVFPLAAAVGGILVLLDAKDRKGFLVRALAAAALAAVMSFPIVMDQVQALVHRTGPTIAVQVYEPLGTNVPERIRPFLNPIAYWLLMFTIEWPAQYLPGLIAVAYALRKGALTRDRALDVRLLTGLVFSALAVTFLLRSVVWNNDLGWRAVMPGFLVLTALTAAGLANWFRGGIVTILTVLLIGLGLPNGMEHVRRLFEGSPSPSAAEFAKAPALWEAVRRHAGPEDRVINNPLYLGSLTPWPTNISWALLANRRSCYAVWELVMVYSPLGRQVSYDIAQVYNRTFAGTPASDDLEKMAVRYDCDVAVVTPGDGAWNNDPFANSRYYVAVEATPEWRIYRRRP